MEIIANNSLTAIRIYLQYSLYSIYSTYFPLLRYFSPSVSFFLALAISEGLRHLGRVDAVGFGGFLNPDRGSIHHSVGAGISEATVCKHGLLDSH